MQSTRQNKICRLIQQDMGDIFLKEMKPVFGQSLITVTQVRITPDLSIARIYVSLMMIGGGTKEEQLRIIPHLEFYLDDSLDFIENIERLLKQ